MATTTSQREIVVTGVGAICSGGRSIQEVWEQMRAGRASIDHPKGELAAFADAWVGEVPDQWLSPAITAAEREDYDRSSLLAVHAALDALATAGLTVADLPEDRTAIVLGRCQGTPADVEGMPAPLHTTAGDLGRYLGVRGSSAVIATACAAGANAIGLARDKLMGGEADIALAGGVDVLIAATFLGFEALQSLSTNPCAPYTRSDGLSLGEGAAILVLERAADVRRRRAKPLAQVLGYGLSADAHHATAPDPTARGPVAAVRRALVDAGIGVDEVDYVNGHGTGTEANDSMERKAMVTLFGERVGAVPISATKSFFGHTLGASGALEAAISVLALRDGILPPTAAVPEADRAPAGALLDIVAGEGRQADLGVVLSNNYAFGGNNASLVLGRGDRPWTGEPVGPDPAAAVAITGFGPVGALGVGLPAWLDAFRAGRAAAAGAAPELPRRPFTDPKRWRQMNQMTQWCVAATCLACDDADLPMSASDRAGTALVFGTGYGPVLDAIRFSDAASASSVSVSRFAGVTINAPAGAVCRALGFKGPTTTLTAGSASFHHALATARDLVASGQVVRAVVLAADEVGPALRVLRARADPFEPARTACLPYASAREGTWLGQGALACVVERPDAARERGAGIYAEISGVASFADPYPLSSPRFEPRSYARPIAEALERAGVDPAAVGYCAGAGTGHDGDRAEAAGLSLALDERTQVSAPSALTGDCESVSGAMNVLAAALACSDRPVPSLPLTTGLVDELRLRPVGPGDAVHADHAVATAFAWGGHYAAAVLSRSRSAS